MPRTELVHYIGFHLNASVAAHYVSHTTFGESGSNTDPLQKDPSITLNGLRFDNIDIHFIILSVG